jgi:hypothetical protein
VRIVLIYLCGVVGPLREAVPTAVGTTVTSGVAAPAEDGTNVTLAAIAEEATGKLPLVLASFLGEAVILFM